MVLKYLKHLWLRMRVKRIMKVYNYSVYEIVNKYCLRPAYECADVFYTTMLDHASYKSIRRHHSILREIRTSETMRHCVDTGIHDFLLKEYGSECFTAYH